MIKEFNLELEYNDLTYGQHEAETLYNKFVKGKVDTVQDISKLVINLPTHVNNVTLFFALRLKNLIKEEYGEHEVEFKSNCKELDRKLNYKFENN